MTAFFVLFSSCKLARGFREKLHACARVHFVTLSLVLCIVCIGTPWSQAKPSKKLLVASFLLRSSSSRSASSLPHVVCLLILVIAFKAPSLFVQEGKLHNTPNAFVPFALAQLDFGASPVNLLLNLIAQWAF